MINEWLTLSDTDNHTSSKTKFNSNTDANFHIYWYALYFI